MQSEKLENDPVLHSFEILFRMYYGSHNPSHLPDILSRYKGSLDPVVPEELCKYLGIDVVLLHP